MFKKDFYFTKIFKKKLKQILKKKKFKKILKKFPKKKLKQILKKKS